MIHDDHSSEFYAKAWSLSLQHACFGSVQKRAIPLLVLKRSVALSLNQEEGLDHCATFCWVLLTSLAGTPFTAFTKSGVPG